MLAQRFKQDMDTYLEKMRNQISKNVDGTVSGINEANFYNYFGFSVVSASLVFGVRTVRMDHIYNFQMMANKVKFQV